MRPALFNSVHLILKQTKQFFSLELSERGQKYLHLRIQQYFQQKYRTKIAKTDPLGDTALTCATVVKVSQIQLFSLVGFTYENFAIIKRCAAYVTSFTI